jgi:hypothetical protein
MGHAPQIFANAASDLIRVGLSPATIIISATESGPMPNARRNVGTVMRRDFGGQGKPSRGQGVQRVLRSIAWLKDGGWRERQTRVDQFAVGQWLQRFAELTGRIHEQRLERDDCTAFGLYCGIARNLHLPYHLGGAVGGLWYGGRDSREHRARCGFCVESVALAIVAPFPPVAVIDLDHAEGLAPNEARQPHAIRSRPFDAKRFDRPKTAGPRHQLRIAGAVSRHTMGRQPRAEAIDGDGDVHMFMGIHTDDDGGGRSDVRATARHPVDLRADDTI